MISKVEGLDFGDSVSKISEVEELDFPNTVWKMFG
jgi:hypothetical protein